MKNGFLHRGFSVVLSVLVLFSTFSFTVEKHFCGNTLVDVAIFSEAHDCGMEMPLKAKNSCCKDEVDIVKGQDELNYNFQDYTLELKLELAAFTYSYISLYESLPEQIIPFKDYSPPNLYCDRQILYQTYLI